jgi:hypothetical protein
MTDDEKKFTVWVGEQRLVFRAVDNEKGVTHHLVVSGELMRCNFNLAEGNNHEDQACPTGALSKPKASESG